MDERRRPLGIVIIVILEIVNAVIGLADLILGTSLWGGAIGSIAIQSEGLRGLIAVWGTLVIVAAVLLWSLNRRGWALMMLLVGISLVSNLLIWWFRPAETQWVNLGLSVVTAFYLNSAAVRRLFIERHEVSRITLGGGNAQ